VRCLALTALVAFALSSAPVFADVGPPVPCERGTHGQYLYGHNCVRDGYHLERKDGGGIQEVPNEDTAHDLLVKEFDRITAPHPEGGSVELDATAPPAGAPPRPRSCGCELAGASGSRWGEFSSLAAVLAMFARRRRSRASAEIVSRV
jgi:hypothetical protein